MKRYTERPETLELTQEQVALVAETFLDTGNPKDVATRLYVHYDRTDFPFFMAPVKDFDPENPRYKFDKPHFEAEGIELLHAAMKAEGAIVTEGGSDFFVVGHPLVTKLAEVAKFDLPKRGIHA